MAAVVDPRFDIDVYLDLAWYMGVRIAHVFETHNHADHVSGHGRLAAATGAGIHVHRTADPGYACEPFEDGDEFELGSLTVRALHTPGHRPEHTAFVLIDTGRGGEPWAVLTGDSLFVGDIARPDLAVEEHEGAREIFRSLHERLLSLPPEVEVWPGHLGGSMCGGPGMDLKIASTVGFERDHNSMLSIGDEEEFVETVLNELGPQPPHFHDIVELNTGPLLTESVEISPLSPRELEEKGSAGALLVDVRSDQQFDDAHIAGALGNPMTRAGFGSKLGWLVERDQEVVFVGRDDADGRMAGTARRSSRPSPARRFPSRGHDDLAPRGAAGCAAGAPGPRCTSRSCPVRSDPADRRRAGARRMGGGPHPRFEARGLARHSGDSRWSRRRQADRRRLRLRSASGDCGQPAAAPWRGASDSRGRRWRAKVGPPRQQARELMVLRRREPDTEPARDSGQPPRTAALPAAPM